VYSHLHGDHDDSRNPRSSQDCRSRWLGTGIQKLCSTTTCSGGGSPSPTQPSGRPHGSESGGGRRPGEASVQEVEVGG
jgi:hypothetical protein